MSDIIKIRRDTFANWQAANPTPALGEITYDMTNSQFRIGDGTSAWLSLSPVGNTPISDGDRGDITVSASGATWMIDSGVVGTSKLGGDITTAGKALLDDASAGDQRTTLGLGTMATQSALSVAITGGSISGITEAFSTPLNQALVKVGRNQTGSPIAKGQVVYILGSQGTHLTIALANNSTEPTSSKTIGVAAEAIADNSTGFIICTGILGGLDTNLLTEGAAIWLDSSAGGMTTTKPAAPNHTVQVGWCVKQGSGASGIIYVHIANGHELDELHDVKITSIANNDLIRWDSATSTWKNFQGSTLFSTVGHGHAIADVTNLQTTLDGKAASSHSHVIADTTGLQTALDGKAASSHTHAIADVTNLQTTLDGKAASSHTHALTDLQAGSATATQVVQYNGTNWVPASLLITDVTGLATMLGTFASVSHNHDLSALQAGSATSGQYVRFNGTNWVPASIAIADVTNLQTTLDGKAASSHTHAIADVTNLQTTLDGKAASSHSHVIADTTGLQTALDGKAASSHTHALTDLQAGSATATQVVQYNGTNWVPANVLITDVTGLATMLGTFSSIGHGHPLSEIQASSATSGQVPRFNGTNWVAATLAITDTSGTVPTNRLGTGTATHGNVLWGDQTWRNATCRPATKPLSGSVIVPGVVAVAYGTIAGTANALDLVPVRCIKDTAVNAIACNVTALVASSKARLAVYESNSDGWPTGTPVLESGVLDCGSTGTKSTAVSFTLLGDRQYWFAIWYSSNPTFRAQGVGSFTIIGGGPLTGTAVNNKIRITGVTYGDATAFRDFTANPVTNSQLTAGSMPVVALTVA